MAKTIGEAIRNARLDPARNTQEVFDRIPKVETKTRQKVNYDDLFERHAKKHCPVYKMDNALRTMKNYFQQIEEFDTGAVLNDANIFKGLLVFGDFGTGKSLFFKIIQSMSRDLIRDHGYAGLHFGSVSAPWMVQEYMKATEKGYAGNFQFTSYYKGRLYIDDLGAERLAFGRDNIMADLLFERHRSGAMTFVSTNLTPKELGEKYGARIGDRIPEFFNIINMSGKSYRES